MTPERLSRTTDVNPETVCSFTPDDRNHDPSGPNEMGMEEELAEQIFESSGGNDKLDFWPWVNKVS